MADPFKDIVLEKVMTDEVRFIYDQLPEDKQRIVIFNYYFQERYQRGHNPLAGIDPSMCVEREHFDATVQPTRFDSSTNV